MSILHSSSLGSMNALPGSHVKSGGRVTRKLRAGLFNTWTEEYCDSGAEETTLMSLPEKVLVSIIKLMDEATILSFAYTCRFIYNIAIPEYIDVSESHEFPGQLRQFKNWTSRTCLSLSFRHPEHYRCIPLVTLSPAIQSLSDVWFHITPTRHDMLHQAARFLQAMSATENLCISFGSKLPGRLRPVEWEWDALHTCGLVKILRALANKRVTRLTLQARGCTTAVAPEHSSTYFFMEDERCYETLESLQDVYIAVPAMSVPCFRLWMVESLNASPLRSLTLESRGVPESAWTKLFRSLQLPSLRHVKLNIDSLRARAFSQFLKTNRWVRSLNVQQDLLDEDSFMHLRALSYLEDLTSTAINVSRVLKNTDALPCLSQIRIVSRGLRTCPDLLHIAECMAALASWEATRPIKLILDVDQLNHDAEPPQPPLSWTMDEEGNQMENPELAYFWDEHANCCAGISRSIAQAPCLLVRTLEVTLFTGLRFTTSLYYGLKQWLSWCPSVERLLLSCSTYTEQDAHSLLRTLWKDFPAIQAIEISSGYRRQVHERSHETMEVDV
ncbi:hypothetical protein OE88DRAFT_1808515 [Heliocybe sulcata]|uniref:F-box domain-containing protein n=1 Tax=Heliocybe sulcata TaxID=5364 RepID=A0A5C3N1R7_9AGAM|nr:hypothetical protein OE88DRAFT_1808515 [Heliocybe sulcata]